MCSDCAAHVLSCYALAVTMLVWQEEQRKGAIVEALTHFSVLSANAMATGVTTTRMRLQLMKKYSEVQDFWLTEEDVNPSAPPTIHPDLLHYIVTHDPRLSPSRSTRPSTSYPPNASSPPLSPSSSASPPNTPPPRDGVGGAVQSGDGVGGAVQSGEGRCNQAMGWVGWCNQARGGWGGAIRQSRSNPLPRSPTFFPSGL
ncbi:unnamed protein product [Closterium sp. Naga37s-1]|nr:unnamed protein product [Closterium sp. Naga37s-1]